jgi:phosphoribosylformylglycinamidine cyclo-ligase
VGVVERKRLIDGSHMEPGDVAIGLASSGLHSNGYSLVRKVVFEMAGHGCDDVVPELDNCRVADILLTPTRLYARPVRRVLGRYRVKQVVHAIAHITGGGIVENLGRVVPDRLQVELSRSGWEVPSVFRWIQRLGGVEPTEMDRVFNMGIGMVLVVSPHFAASIRRQIADCGIETFELGRVRAATAADQRVVLR